MAGEAHVGGWEPSEIGLNKISRSRRGDVGPRVDFVHVMEVGPAHEEGAEDISARRVGPVRLVGGPGPCWHFAGMN